jgi:hypothetical protein
VTQSSVACVTASDRGAVPLRLWATDGVLVPPELPGYSSDGGSGADARPVPAGDARLHVWTVRLPAGVHGVSTALHTHLRTTRVVGVETGTNIISYQTPDCRVTNYMYLCLVTYTVYQ